jgi:glycosyltransferase involved in cell wall biosynthesis
VANVMVVPSLTENLSNAIMESLSCATPVVAFNIGGNSDMIDHQQNGYLAEPYSSEDLAKGIKYCVENNTNNVLGAASRESAVRRFAVEVVSKQYKQLYLSLVFN